jgi:DNA polymerase (family 10)
MKDKVKHIERYGTTDELTALQAYMPLLDIMGIGPKFILDLVDKDIVIKKPEDLLGKVKLNDLQLLGIKNYKRILHDIDRDDIKTISAVIHKYVKCKRFDVVGSYRRGKETSGDIDILVTDLIENEIPDAPECFAIVQNGKKRFTFLYKYGKYLVHVDLRFIEMTDYPSALMYFTGSGDFNMMLRGIAKSKGYLLNEYGLFENNEKLPLESETEIFKKLGYDYIPPEKRYTYSL